MSRRYPRLLITALLASLALILAGCGEGWALAGRKSGPGIQLTYALWDPIEQQGYQKSINEFEALHPNIHVTIEQIPYGNYEQKITAEYVSHSAPDVFWINTPFLANWIQDGLVKNLSPLIKRDHINMRQYYPALVKLHERKGKIYGLPKDWDTIALYYNKDYFAKHHVKVPSTLTWTPAGTGTFLKMLQAATTDRNGKSMGTPGFNEHAIKTYAITIANDIQGGYGNYLAMNGASVLPQPYATTVSFTKPAAISTFQYLTGLIHNQHVAVPAGEMGPNAGGSTAVQLFAQGRVAIYEAGDWNTRTVTSSVKFHVGVLPLPSGPKGRVSVFNGLIDGINSNTPYPKAAWQLEKWLGSAKSQKIMGDGGYIWPAIKSLDPLFLAYWNKHGINMQPFLTEAHGNVVNFPVSPGIGQAITDITQYLGPAYLGSQSVPAAVSAAAKTANHDLQTYY